MIEVLIMSAISMLSFGCGYVMGFHISRTNNKNKHHD